MFDPTVAAYVFCILTAVVVVFQMALALGAPWGEMAMGGKYPGRFPPKMRIAALVQLLLLIVIAFIVLIRAEIFFEELFEISKTAIWYVVAFCVVSAILNVITPSTKERKLWAPVAIIMVICAFIVAES